MGIRLAPRITRNVFPAERLSTRGKGESGESAKQESESCEGLKTGALCGVVRVHNPPEAKNRRAARSLTPRTTLYLFS